MYLDMGSQLRTKRNESTVWDVESCVRVHEKEMEAHEEKQTFFVKGSKKTTVLKFWVCFV